MGKLHNDETSPSILWAEIHRLQAEAKGPDGFETWRDAAVAEKVKRVALESKLASQQLDHELSASYKAHQVALKEATHKHYKGGLYRFHDLGIHSETKEEMVIYEHLWPHKRQYWVRPMSSWVQPVEGSFDQRFAPIKRTPTLWQRIKTAVQSFVRDISP